MLKRLSLRARLTIWSAVVMTGVAVTLTVVSLVNADRLFVKNMSATLSEGATFEPDAGVDNDYPEIGYTRLELKLNQAGRRFHVWGIAGLAGVTLLGVGVTWLMAGHALRPVRDLSDAIQEISGKDLSRRVDVQGRQDEIGQLAQSFNAMMDKVNASFDRQQRFAASAAHELKTPLTTIQVGLEVLDLDEEPDPARMQKALAVTKANTERLIRLVEDLSRLSADEAYDRGDVVPVRALLAAAAEELSPLIRAKELTVSVEADPSLTLTGSRILLYRALCNLVENAAKYNRPGGTITLTAAAQEGMLTVRVADTGVGIPEDELSHIFEPFYRVDRSRSRAVGGSGLGLALVQDIVARHSGDIQVESRPGEGTVFLLRLPFQL